MLKKILLSLLFLATIRVSIAEVVKPAFCKEFSDLTELYLINSSYNEKELKTSTGETFTFKSLLEKTWPQKKIISINPEEYNELKNVSTKFFITISEIEIITRDNFVESTTGVMSGIIIKKGKFKYEPGKTMAWLNLNIADIYSDELSERLIYGVNSLDYMIKNYQDKSLRTNYLYKQEGVETILSKKTLYIREDMLNEKFLNPEKIKQVYPYNFKIVSANEWKEAISQKKSDVIYFEEFHALGSSGGAQNFHYTGFDVIDAKEGKVIISSYPWLKLNGYYKLDKTAFQKLF